jgi:hypothetical protein
MGIPNIFALRITILAPDHQSSRLAGVMGAYLIEKKKRLHYHKHYHKNYITDS